MSPGKGREKAMQKKQICEVPFEDFAGTTEFPLERVKQWAEWVVELRWGDHKDFVKRRLPKASPYFFRLPVGSGVLLDNGLVLTCAHVFSPPSSVRFPMIGNRKAPFHKTVTAMRVVFGHRRGGKRVRERLIRHVSYWGTQVDAAFIDFAGYSTARGGGLPNAQTAAAANGDPICILHHAGGGPLAVSVGKVTAVDPAGQWFRHDAPTRGGVSGAPIFNREGRLLGIHRGVDGALGDDATAVPILVIRKFTSSTLDPRSSVPQPSPQKGRRWRLPAMPATRQEIDIGSFDVFNRNPSADPRVACCWVASDRQHEAWAMLRGQFVNAGTTPADNLLFRKYLMDGALRNWWMDFGGKYPNEPLWVSPPNPPVWVDDWKTWAATRLGVQPAAVDYVYHSRYSDPQP